MVAILDALTFEKLVQETAHRLDQNPTTKHITADKVRDVLQDVGIDETLRSATAPPPGRLMVHSVLIGGEKRLADSPFIYKFEYQRKLGSGLWAWVGPNGTGKSTILNCILWALTGSDSSLSKRSRSWVHDVAVQFSVGGGQFTSRVVRTVDGNVSGGIYHGFPSVDQIDLGHAEAAALFRSRDEMRETIDLFFMQHLSMTTMRWTMHGSEKDDPDLHAHSTTWRTYAHAIQIEDDSYDDLIIDPLKGYGRQDRKILEMMLGVDHARAVAEIQVQADFAKEAYGRARSRVGGRQSNLADQIRLLDAELADVTRAIELMQAGQAPVEDDSAIVARREQRARLLAEQNQIAQEIAGLDTRKTDLERDQLAAERQRNAIQEQSEVEYLINSLAVVRCPHCESAVDSQDRLVREREEHTCHVCMQPLQRTRVTGDLKGILKTREQEIATIKANIKRVQQEISDRQAKLAASREEASRISRELEANVMQARQGFTTSFANVLVRKGQIEGQLAQLRRSQSEIDAEKTEVETAAMWFQVLQTAAEIADEAVFKMYETVFSELSRLVIHLATQFGVPDLEQVEIDEKRTIKLNQGGVQLTHNELSRSERVKFKIAFHLALMLLQVRAGLGKHPGFLVIDTPGTAEVDDMDFASITHDLVNLHDEYGDRIQILLATARQEAREYLPAALTETPRDTTFF